MRELAIVVSNDNTTVTPFETIDAIAAAGFRKIFLQWYNRPWEITQEQQLAYARRKGLTVIFAHLGYKGLNAIWAAGDEGEQLTEGYLRDLDVMRDNGIDHVVMHLNGKLEAPPWSVFSALLTVPRRTASIFPLKIPSSRATTSICSTGCMATTSGCASTAAICTAIFPTTGALTALPDA